MSARQVKKLSDEDRVLWSLVARSARPLKGRKPPDEPLVPVGADPVDPAASPASAGAVPERRSATRLSHSLDVPTLEKLARGRLPIEGRVDLHGLTQTEAHRLLLAFLERAHANRIRYVLVITGKGTGGEGVLKRLVPAWLSTPPFRAFVSSHDQAARGHGGGGALYVRLRRQAGRER
jgi:DNA-nicking Smr family endonuclease